MALHEKVDSLREKQWEQLLALQQDQIGMLKKIVENVQEKSRQFHFPPFVAEYANYNIPSLMA